MIPLGVKQAAVKAVTRITPTREAVLAAAPAVITVEAAVLVPRGAPGVAAPHPPPKVRRLARMTEDLSRS